jgi:hypothetical protein
MAQHGAVQGARSQDEYFGFAALDKRVNQQPLQQADCNRIAGAEDSEDLSIMGWGR